MIKNKNNNQVNEPCKILPEIKKRKVQNSSQNIATFSMEEVQYTSATEVNIQLPEYNFSSFDYPTKLLSEAIVENGYLLTASIQIGFLTLRKLNISFCSSLKQSEPTGWKIHIAVDDSKHSNIATAWNIVKYIAIKENLGCCKVIQVGTHISPTNVIGTGKQITIYHFYSPDRDWQLIIQQMEDALIKAGVKPILRSIKDKPIEGSIFFSYRNDKDKNGKYLKAENCVGYNDVNDIDPLVNIKIRRIGNIYNHVQYPRFASMFHTEKKQRNYLASNKSITYYSASQYFYKN